MVTAADHVTINAADHVTINAVDHVTINAAATIAPPRPNVRALDGYEALTQSFVARTIVVHLYFNWLVFTRWRMAHREALKNRTKKPS